MDLIDFRIQMLLKIGIILFFRQRLCIEISLEHVTAHLTQKPALAKCFHTFTQHVQLQLLPHLNYTTQYCLFIFQ